MYKLSEEISKSVLYNEFTLKIDFLNFTFEFDVLLIYLYKTFFQQFINDM
jgi:hypothetical protein